MKDKKIQTDHTHKSRPQPQQKSPIPLKQTDHHTHYVKTLLSPYVPTIGKQLHLNFKMQTIIK